MFLLPSQGEKFKCSVLGWGQELSFQLGHGFTGWLLVSGPFGLGISVLLGHAWREQPSQGLKHFVTWLGKQDEDFLTH